MSTSFAEYRYKSRPAIGRVNIIDRIVRELRTRRLNVVGARSTGKSCLARAVATDLRIREMFQGVVSCDLKNHACEGDEAFLKALTGDMHHQLPESVSKVLLDPKAGLPYEDALNETVEEWHSSGQRILIILDGIDDAFLSLGDGWEFLCGLVEHESVQFLCTSRRRIRELCNTRAKVGSNMHQRFKNPIDLPPLDAADIESIAAVGGSTPATGVAAALLSWTGGHAAITIALCDEAQGRINPGASLTVEAIKEAAQQMVSEPCEELELAWGDIQADERELFIMACRTGEVPAFGTNGARLQKLGFLKLESGVLKPGCRLMREFAGKAASGVALFREWFGTGTAYLASMKQVLTLRVGPEKEDEPDVIRNVRDAIEAIERPDKAARAFRDIVKEAIELIWDAELPKREVPYFTAGPDWLCRERRWPTDNTGSLIMLNMMTNDRKWATPPKQVNRKIFAMVSFLTLAGDFKNHQHDQKMTAGFLASAVATAVELVGEMKLVGLL